MIIIIRPSNKSILLAVSTDHLGCSEGQIDLYEGLCHDVIQDYVEERARC